MADEIRADLTLGHVHCMQDEANARAVRAVEGRQSRFGYRTAASESGAATRAAIERIRDIAEEAVRGMPAEGGVALLMTIARDVSAFLNGGMDTASGTVAPPDMGAGKWSGMEPRDALKDAAQRMEEARG